MPGGVSGVGLLMGVWVCGCVSVQKGRVVPGNKSMYPNGARDPSN